jgi:hypothetical protein
MITEILLVWAVVGPLAGFGIGRIKNAKKLEAIEAEITKAEVAGETEAKKVIDAVKAKL